MSEVVPLGLYRIAVPYNTTRYYALGEATFQVSLADADTKFPAGTLKKLVVRVQSNTLDADTTITVMKNDAATPLSITVPAGVTGNFSVASDVTLAEDDLVCLKVVAGGTTGSMAFTYRVDFVSA
ncbi:MAG: hypothetical protein QXH20_04775 [Candidatus Bathyarchaeia archaeon]